MAESKVKDLAIAPIQVRVINELLRYAINHSHSVDGFATIEDRLTHQAIADLVGAARETVTKTLIELKKQVLTNHDFPNSLKFSKIKS